MRRLLFAVLAAALWSAPALADLTITMSSGKPGEKDRTTEGADFDRYVETIPFRETRQYVQNVLSFAVIYAYLDGRSVPIVSPSEQLIRNPWALPVASAG